MNKQIAAELGVAEIARSSWYQAGAYKPKYDVIS